VDRDLRRLGNVVASSARLHGAMPQIPAGIFAAARDGSEQRVTLQPEGGVRAAVVVARYTGGQPATSRSGARCARWISAKEIC